MSDKIVSLTFILLFIIIHIGPLVYGYLFPSIKRKTHAIVNAISLFLIIIINAWIIGIVFDFEYPYSLKIYQARHVQTTTGQPFLPILASKLGCTPEHTIFHTCSSCNETYAKQEGFTYILVTSCNDKKVKYDFLYDHKKKRLKPISMESMCAFPMLLSSKDDCPFNCSQINSKL